MCTASAAATTCCGVKPTCSGLLLGLAACTPCNMLEEL